RKGAKALRFETEIWPFDVSLLFAPLRLSESDCIGCIGSDRPSITTQPYRCCKKHRRDRQPNPKPWRAQISPRSELRQRVNVRVMLALEIKSLRRESGQAIPQHSDKMRRVESNLLED